MQYLLAIVHDESELPPVGTPEREALVEAYIESRSAIEADGNWVTGSPLSPSNLGKTVTIRDGATLISDGPFAESREQLIGFFMVECDTIEEAVAYAATMPGAKTGAIEVRPVQVYDGLDT